jgi:molecular chaperone GrpE
MIWTGPKSKCSTTEDLAVVIEGNQLVFNKLRMFYNKRALLQWKVSIRPFDVEKHEAITEIEAGAKSKGKVVDEVQKGYLLNGKLIRFAKVVVGK